MPLRVIQFAKPERHVAQLRHDCGHQAQVAQLPAERCRLFEGSPCFVGTVERFKRQPQVAQQDRALPFDGCEPLRKQIIPRLLQLLQDVERVYEYLPCLSWLVQVQVALAQSVQRQASIETRGRPELVQQHTEDTDRRSRIAAAQEIASADF